VIENRLPDSDVEARLFDGTLGYETLQVLQYLRILVMRKHLSNGSSA